MKDPQSTLSVAFVALVALGACKVAGGPPKAAPGWSAPATEEAPRPAPSEVPVTMATWSVFENVDAGLRVELPCTRFEKASSPGRIGPIAFEVRSVSCTAGGTRFVVEYWDDVKMTAWAPAAINKETIEPVVTTWLEGPKAEGYVLTSKRTLEGPAGWMSLETRFTRQQELRVDRHYLISRRKIRLTTISSVESPADAERFVTSLRVWQPGVPFEQASGKLAERVIEVGGARFSVSLPCRPSPGEESTDGPSSDESLSRTFSCMHPSANGGFQGIVFRFDEPLPTAASGARKAKSLAVASDLALLSCIPAVALSLLCREGKPKALGATAIEVETSAGNDNDFLVRVLVDYPYAFMLAVIGPGKKVAEARTILDSLRLPAR